MTSLPDALQQLCDTDPDVALVLSVFRTIELVHNEALEAMGQKNKYVLDSKSLSEITLSFADTPSTSR